MRVSVSTIAPPAWGLRFDTAANELALHHLPPPPRVCVPLHQHVGSEATPLVAKGDRVLTGQPLARTAAGKLGAAVHAPVSGFISDISPQPVPGKRTPGLTVTIDSDDLDQRWTGFATHQNPLRLSTSALRSAVLDGGIVGLGGATFPSGVKLNRGSGVDTLILNGVECEPVIKCDDALVRHESALMLLGAQIMMRILEADRCIVALKEGMHESLQIVEAALAELADDRFSIAILPPIYPTGGEAQLIQLLTGREMPAGGLPWDSGAICQNVATAAAVARLTTRGEPLISRIVTLTGGGITTPTNFVARIGTPLSMLIEAAGGYAANSSRRLIMGGPMMGVSLTSDTLPVTKATNCIYIPAVEELPRDTKSLPCIRCDDCAAVCPVNLMPQLLLQTSHVNDFDRLQQLGLTDCIECGCCDYVCPSKIPLTRQFVDAKQELWQIAFEKRRGEQANQRINARTARKQRDAQELEETLADQTLNIASSADARAELNALLKRTGVHQNDAEDNPKDSTE